MHPPADEDGFEHPNSDQAGEDSWSDLATERGSDRGHENEHLRGVVDMGSNGIRFSVSDLSPPLSRLLRVVQLYRVDIALYDVQFDPETHEQIPIPQQTIDDVVAALIRFKIVCADLGVPMDHIRVVATEATRAAINSKDFLQAIQSSTKLEIDLLQKEEEGRIGAMGVASGFSEIEGLMMDLGGGSTQITWMIFQAGNVRMSPRGSFSFPYGAGALTRRLEEAKRGKSKHDADEGVAKLRAEMVASFSDAFKKLQIPEQLMHRAELAGGHQLYLSGGGFRGWGYVLIYMNQVHGHHYPISIINGFSVGKEQFEDTKAVQEVVHSAHKIFRISDRRREQVPAVAFLISVLAEAIPLGIKEAHFCQGGVREGLLFQELSPRVRRQDPLELATHDFAPTSSTAIAELLIASIPRESTSKRKRFPQSFSFHVIRAFANALYVHDFLDKESASTVALYSTSTGFMSSTRGVSHADRARLALMLEARHMGELPPREVAFKQAISHIITSEETWWTSYLGRVGYLITRLYPARKIDETKPRVILSGDWAWNLGKKKDKEGLRLTVSIQKVEHDPSKLKRALKDHVGVVQKVGKKKNWAGGENGWGMKVEVRVVEEDIVAL